MNTYEEGYLPTVFDVSRKATLHDYQAWLLEYMNCGGKITHFYTFNWPSQEFYVANNDCFLPTLYSIHAINVIVSPFIEVVLKGGHSNLYRHARIDEKTENPGFVPLYLDVDIHSAHIEEIEETYKQDVKKELEFWKDHFSFISSTLEEAKQFEARFNQLRGNR